MERIEWKNGYEKWKIVKINTIGDGNCLFHAIVNSFFEPYRQEKIEDTNITKKEIVKLLRKELSQKLSQKIEGKNITYYEKINGGNTYKFSETISDFKQENMKKILDSNNQIGYGYIEYIGDVLNKDIYILEGKRQDIYKTDEYIYSIKNDREAIVLYYNNGHYELIGLINDNNDIETYFNYNHSFIKFLNEKVNKFLKK